MCLTHYPSKSVCSTRQALELFLEIISAPYTFVEDKSPLQLLPSHALDTLMCTLVDASPTTCGVFEHANGLAIVRSVMNQHSKGSGQITSETNVTAAKCFEFLLFYLQAQSFEDQAEQLAEPTRSTSISLKPPTTPSAGRRAPGSPTAQPYAGPTPRRNENRSGRLGAHAAHLENPFTARHTRKDTQPDYRTYESPSRRTISPRKERYYGHKPRPSRSREEGRW